MNILKYSYGPTQRLEGLNWVFKCYSTNIQMVFKSLVKSSNLWISKTAQEYFKDNQILIIYAK